VHDRLAERARLMNLAISLSTAAAVMICSLIALLFVDARVTFLREVFMASTTLRKAYLRAGRRPLPKAA
jgi:hypothetical protein